MLLICQEPNSSMSKTPGTMGWDFLLCQQRRSISLKKNEVICGRGLLWQGAAGHGPWLPSECFPCCAHPRAPQWVARMLLRDLLMMLLQGRDVLPSIMGWLLRIAPHQSRRGLEPFTNGAASHPPYPSQPFSSFLFYLPSPPFSFPSLLSPRAPKRLCTQGRAHFRLCPHARELPWG